MAQYQTVARPYAEALFECAKGETSLSEAWKQVLCVLAQAVSHPAIVQKIFDPKVSDAELFESLFDILANTVQDCVTRLEQELENFLRLLIANKRLQVVPDLFVLYQHFVLQQNNTINVEVVSAYEMTSERQLELKAALTKKLNSELLVKYKIDPKIIGGLVVRTDEFVMDASIKGKLVRLYHSLNS